VKPLDGVSRGRVFGVGVFDEPREYPVVTLDTRVVRLRISLTVYRRAVGVIWGHGRLRNDYYAKNSLSP